MGRLLAQYAPQRLTQYATLAESLAPAELALSPLAPHITRTEPVELPGFAALALDLEGEPPTLPYLATLGPWFERVEDDPVAPLLRPLASGERLGFTPELVEARRYRGKTNALFTAFMVNVARWSHAGRPRWLLDPMAGGGTTLFAGLRVGLDVMGVERDRTTFEGTDAFLREYLQQARLRHRRVRQRRQAGTRVQFEIEAETGTRRVVMAQGDAREAPVLLDALPGGARPDLIVTDLPYAIQHRSSAPLIALLEHALPAWGDLAAEQAILVMAWNSTNLAREQLVALVADGGWAPMDDGPFRQMEHRVDRVIKRRDVLVARRARGG